MCRLLIQWAFLDDACDVIQVWNLEGSIFKWANEGRPMVDENGASAQCCHPYSVLWGKLLDADRRADPNEFITNACVQ